MLSRINLIMALMSVSILPISGYTAISSDSNSFNQRRSNQDEFYTEHIEYTERTEYSGNSLPLIKTTINTNIFTNGKISALKKPIKQPVIKTDPNLYALLEAEFAYDRGDITKALAIYKNESFTQNATAVFERALTLSLEHEDIYDSLVFAVKWQDKNPEHVPAWFYVAHLGLKAHEYQTASNMLSQILEYDPKADFSQILQGIYPDDEQDQRELLTALQSLHSEENPSLSVLQAGLLLKFDEAEIALIHVDRALKLEADNMAFITLKSDIFKQLQRWDELFGFLHQMRKKHPKQKSLYLYEIRCLLEQEEGHTTTSFAEKNQKKAWKLLLKTTKLFPEDAEITLLASLVSLDIKAYDKGNQLLKSLLDRPSYVSQGNYYLGISAERQQKYQQAKVYFSQVKDEELVLEATQKLVSYELADNNIKGAIRALEILREEFVIYAPDSYILQAELLAKYNRLDEAKKLLSTAREEYGDYQQIIFAQIKLLNNTTDYELKKKILASLIEAEPEIFSYQLHYGKLLISKASSQVDGKKVLEKIIANRRNKHSVNQDNNSINQDGNAVNQGNNGIHKKMVRDEVYYDALTSLAKLALKNKKYHLLIDYLQQPYQNTPSLELGVLLLEGYRGSGNQQKLELLEYELTTRFGYQ